MPNQNFLVPIVSDGNAYMSLYGCNMHFNAGALEREILYFEKVPQAVAQIKYN